VAELALGRRAAGDAIAAFETTGTRSLWRFSGGVGVVGSVLILSYYAVITGWALKYLAGSVTGDLWRVAAEGYGGYFEQFIANRGEPVAWQLAMIAAAMFVVAGGVRRGIEAVNRLLMPLLALFVVGLAAYAATLPGAADGWRFLFVPDWSMLLRREFYIAALGQAFFSLGIGMAVFITYASCMSRSMSIPRSATAIVAGDTLFAVIAGLAIFPAVFAFGMDPQAGPQLAFITLPQIFLQMPAGPFVGTVFFGLLFAAALTSMVELLEVPVATILHRTSLRRWSAVALTGTGVFLLGLPSAVSYGFLASRQLGGRAILDVLDQAVSGYVLPLAGVLVCLFVGWRWRPDEALEAGELAPNLAGRAWLWSLRVVAPVTILLILFDSTGAL
jgi:NSS family neurotransmitter:Na+ symporter